MSQPGAVVAPTTHAAHEVHHEELGFWRKYVFSTDHKVIGIQYAITGLLFLLFGFSLMMLMRWQLAYPGAPLPLLGSLLGEARMPGGTGCVVADLDTAARMDARARFPVLEHRVIYNT